MYKAKITSKGQITLPAGLRKELAIGSGDSIVFLPGENGEFHIRRAGSIRDLRGIVQKLGYTVSGPPVTLEEMKNAMVERVAELDEATMSPEGRRRIRRGRKKAA